MSTSRTTARTSRLATELRTRSQQERKSVFWAVALNDAIDRETVELFRSKEMLGRKERETQDGRRDSAHRRREGPTAPPSGRAAPLLKAACLSGSVYFRGNDRSP